MKPDDMVFIGSPGTTVSHASDLGLPPGHVWAGAHPQDPVPHAGDALSEDFGGNPVHHRYGAQVFSAGTPGSRWPGLFHKEAHGSYWLPNSQALPNIAHIVNGEYSKVTGPSAYEIAATNSISGQIIELVFNPLEPRDSHGEWTHGGTGVIEKVTEPIGEEGARGNSRAVSHGEFQQIAARGRDRLRAIQGAPWSTDGLSHNWDQIKQRTYSEVQKSWGGATVDPRTGEDLPQGADKYAMSVKPTGLDTTSVPEHASQAEFSQAMDIAKDKYGRQLAKGGSYLGIFHDDDLNRIDIDPVTVLDNLSDVESVGAYTHAIGGAYHFKSGDGFWPPHVPGGAAMSNENTHWAGPGQWHSHTASVQQPHDEPEDKDSTTTGQIGQDSPYQPATGNISDQVR
jgi:hypothetical protein